MNQCIYCKKIFYNEGQLVQHIINILVGIGPVESFCSLIYKEMLLTRLLEYYGY